MGKAFSTVPNSLTSDGDLRCSRESVMGRYHFERCSLLGKKKKNPQKSLSYPEHSSLAKDTIREARVLTAGLRGSI